MLTDAGQFGQRLYETVAWCLPRVVRHKPKWCLRSPELRPMECDGGSDDPTLWNAEPVIQAVAFTRSKLLNSPAISSDGELQGGRLLLCYFDFTNHNELTADETSWFFDANDNPPWDTWIDVIGGALVSWIPQEFHAAVDRAIAVEAVGMLMWLENPVIGLAVNRSDLQRIPRWLYDYSVQPYCERE